VSAPLEAARLALAQYDGLQDGRLTVLSGGLINDTYLVETSDSKRGRFVLQRVNPIFDPRIHTNILAVTERLLACSLPSPELLRDKEGQLFVEVEDQGMYRVMTYVEGATFEVASGPRQVASAAELVGRFHVALDGLDEPLECTRLGVHDTDAHLARLEKALAERQEHRLHGDVSSLGRSILERAGRLAPLPELTLRNCHGDLKLSNIRFAGQGQRACERALCLIDLDTLAPMHLGHELGDALRSWTNRATESSPEAQLDMNLLGAAVKGYGRGIARALTNEEAEAILLGPEWISLELAARFAADALEEVYFGWDPSRYETRGEHNLVRARGQLALHRAFETSRRERESIGAATA